MAPGPSTETGVVITAGEHVGAAQSGGKGFFVAHAILQAEDRRRRCRRGLYGIR